MDDDMNACQSAAAMLRQLGMRSEWCMYGKEAIARTQEALKMDDYFHVYIIDGRGSKRNGSNGFYQQTSVSVRSLR